ncbi:MAG TPA: MFS transporter, partial [Bacteroidales bacterium]|nr:MFS transporter [Bacteroidales bacterium]
MLKPTILSLSLLTIVSTTAVSPALADIAEYFVSADRFLVQMVVVLHAFAIVPTLAVATWLAERYSRKRVVVSGLTVFVIAGIAGGIVNNIYVLLVLRALLGVGLGMVIPFSTALIADFFEGEERQRLMGMSSSLNMAGGMFALVISGYLAVISWRLPFLIYLCGIPVLVLILLYLPDIHDKHKLEENDKRAFPAHVYKVA